MKRTQIAELFVGIRKTFVSFFSILMFVALGVGIFLGINWSSPALQKVADEAFSQGAFHHFQVQYPYGLTDEDLVELAAVEGVTGTEEARQSFQTLVVDGDRYAVKVQTLGRDIDTPQIVEGTLPTKPDELAFHERSAETLGVKVGDVLTFEKDLKNSEGGASAAQGSAKEDADGMQYLNSGSFKVTAIVNTAEYVVLAPFAYGQSSAPSGNVDGIAWVAPEAFDASAFLDAYPVVNVACESLDSLPTFGGAYEQASSSIEARIEEVGDKLGAARYDDLHNKAQSKIDKAQKQIDDAKSKIESGTKQLKEARETLEREREEGERKLEEAHQQLLEFEDQKAQGEAELADARDKLARGEQALAEADATRDEVASLVDDARSFKADLDDQLRKNEIDEDEYDKELDRYGRSLAKRIAPVLSELDLPAGLVDREDFEDALSNAETALSLYDQIPVEYEGETMTLGEAREKLEDGRQQVADGEAELAEKSAQLEEGWEQYYAGQEELETKVAEGEQKIAEGEKQVEQAKKKVAEGEPKLEDAKKELEGMTKYQWTVMTRPQNVAAAQVDVLGSVPVNLSFSMAALFVFVGLLVSYSAVSRIVHEQVTQIGTKKALGIRAREITASYLGYAGIAVLSGAVVGTVMGVFVVERIIGAALTNMFVFGDFPPYFDLPMFLAVTALELALVLGATWLACHRVLKQHAVDLLRGEKPPGGKTRFFEKWAFWDKLPLFTQTIVNNCLNEKRRVFSTVVGVAGCTALIVTAITLNNDVLESYDRHYDSVYDFNAIAFVDAQPEDAATKTAEALQQQGARTAEVVRKTMAFELGNGGYGPAFVLAPVDEAAFSQLYHINPVAGGPVDLSQDGVWVSQAFMEHLGAKVGDEVVLDSRDGIEHKVKILGFYEFRLTFHEMVMGHDAYEREFGKTAAGAVIADTGGTSVDEVKASLADVPGFWSISDDKVFQYGNFATFSNISSAVVAVYVAISVLMALVVLLNLNVMFIEEKKRELIVLMINGFSVRDAKRYITGDTIVLTAIGIVLGIVLGCIAGAVTVGAIEPSTASFLKGVNGMAVAIGVVGSALLAFAMSSIALRRIPRFSLTDINKF